MPAKKPRHQKPKAPLPFLEVYGRMKYGRKKQAERDATEAARKASFLALAEKHPDLRYEIMAVYDKPARKTTRREREAMLANAPPEVAALSRSLSESVKKHPTLPRREKT